MANISDSSLQTRVVSVIVDKHLGSFNETKAHSIEEWTVPTEETSTLTALKQAADLLKTSDIPVAFPTETVYGLGADATRSSAVKGIYKAKGRPSDNPLIIHVSDLNMLRALLPPQTDSKDPIPEIYKPIITRFWPGPLTILLPNPENPKLAPEVTAGNSTFAVRMPSSALALSLIKLAGVPIAAPSANASTKPSPTTAQHVLQDLNGKIDLILDGGPCSVGVESTVIDGLSNPPVVLRPGGVSMEMIRSCPGWENVQKAYQDGAQNGESAPRAPGMKYKHYSPNTKVILVEAGATSRPFPESLDALRDEIGCVENYTVPRLNIAILRTKSWPLYGGWENYPWVTIFGDVGLKGTTALYGSYEGKSAALFGDGFSSPFAKIFSCSLGRSTELIAQNLFWALRELDSLGADAVYVEGIETKDGENDIAAAVMNRLRKAASVIKS